jgi:hypothetical protein
LEVKTVELIVSESASDHSLCGLILVTVSELSVFKHLSFCTDARQSPVTKILVGQNVWPYERKQFIRNDLAEPGRKLNRFAILQPSDNAFAQQTDTVPLGTLSHHFTLSSIYPLP